MFLTATAAVSDLTIRWDFIIGGLALFLFGIQFMGDGLKSIAGSKLRDYIDRYTSKPWKGIIVGAVITVFIQSSSATSAIAISFVRAGLMTLEQSVGIIIGANIGTTVTSFLHYILYSSGYSYSCLRSAKKQPMRDRSYWALVCCFSDFA